MQFGAAWYIQVMNPPIKHISELPAAARGVLESLVGQPLDDQQHVFIVVADPDTAAFRARRQQARRRLEESLREFHAAVVASGLSAHEIEQTIDEVCDDVRYGSQ